MSGEAAILALRVLTLTMLLFISISVCFLHTQGVLLNKFETDIALFDRNMSAGYFASAHRVLDDCMKEELQNQQRGQLRAAYKRLIGSDATPDVKAKARSDIGELCLSDGDKLKALTEFREALKLNPKIGLKRKLADIKKNKGR